MPEVAYDILKKVVPPERCYLGEVLLWRAFARFPEMEFDNDGKDWRFSPDVVEEIAAPILVLKKCKKPDDVLFINATEHFVKGKRQNQLTDDHIAKIINTYQFRKEEDRYSRRIGMERIAEEGYNLNISRYISTTTADEEIDLKVVNAKLVDVEEKIKDAKDTHNAFLRQLGLTLLP